MSESHLLLLLKLCATALIAGGAFLIGSGVARLDVLPGRRLLDAYVAYLDRALRRCFITLSPGRIVRWQALATLLGLALFLASGTATLLLLPLVALLGPAAQLALLRRQRSTKFMAQTDGFLLALANALKAVPNIGAALSGLLGVLQDPVRQEITVALNEMRVGSSLDQALLNASARAENQAFDGAVSALLIGQKVGGDLPKILETTAATLREMNRLEGVVQSKTSESRAQLWVLGCFPVGIALVFNAVSPGFFEPLLHTITGQIVSAVALVMWLAAIALARQLSRIDL